MRAYLNTSFAFDIQSLDGNDLPITASDIDWAGELRVTSMQRGSCDGALGTNVIAGLVVLVPVKCSSAWKVKCASGFKHAALDLGVSFVADGDTFSMRASFGAFVIDESGTDLPTVRAHRLFAFKYAASVTVQDAECIAMDTAVMTLAIADGIKLEIASTLFSTSPEWRCPAGVCAQKDFVVESTFAPTPRPTPSPTPLSAPPLFDSSPGAISVLDCTPVGLGALGCALRIAAKPECSPSPPPALADECRCTDQVFDCLVTAGCKVNAAARTPDRVKQCQAICPGSNFCAASSIIIHWVVLMIVGISGLV